MSAHSMFVDWELGEPIPEGLAEDIALCVKMNLRIKPTVFAELCHADAFVSLVTDAVEGEEETESWVKRIVNANPCEEDVEKLLRDVAARLKETKR